MSRGPNNSLPVPRRNVTYGERAGSHFPPVSASHENDYDDESFNFSQKPRQARGGGWGGEKEEGLNESNHLHAITQHTHTIHTNIVTTTFA